MKKDKVIGVRIDAELFAILEFDRVNELTRNPGNKAARTTSSWAADILKDGLDVARFNYEKEQKRLAAAEKRRINKEAKKAANDAI